MVELPEERQVAALRHVAELGERKRKLQEELDLILSQLQDATIEAYGAGTEGSRVAELGHISRGQLYAWLKEAGVPVGKPRGRVGRKPAKK